jgi:ABC-type antimicrobial peptide transport system permease subunit
LPSTTAVGVATGAAWISYTVGRILGRFARRPATMLAGRRLQLDPWAGSRTLAALLTAVLFGAGAAWITASIRLQQQLRAEDDRRMQALTGTPYLESNDEFYTRAMQLVGYAILVAGAIAAAGLAVAVITAIVDRRRSLAALTASGVPRSVLGRAVLWQSLFVAIPALVLAIATGLALGRGFAGSDVQAGGGSISYCAAPPCAVEQIVEFPEIRAAIQVPWSDLGVLGGWSLGAATLAGLLGVAFLRSATSPEELRTT